MSFPQPAGYYGLKLSEELEARITSFNLIKLATTNVELALYLHDRIYQEAFPTDEDLIIDTAQLSKQDDEFISELRVSELIAFQRWISDRLAFLHTVPVQEVKS